MALYKKMKRNEYQLMLKPWISKEILQKCKIRDHLLKRISKEYDLDKINSTRYDYKKLRNEITKNKHKEKKLILYFENNKQKLGKNGKLVSSMITVSCPQAKVQQKIPYEPCNIVTHTHTHTCTHTQTHTQ